MARSPRARILPCARLTASCLRDSFGRTWRRVRHREQTAVRRLRTGSATWLRERVGPHVRKAPGGTGSDPRLSYRSPSPHLHRPAATTDEQPQQVEGPSLLEIIR